MPDGEVYLGDEIASTALSLAIPLISCRCGWGRRKARQGTAREAGERIGLAAGNILSFSNYIILILYFFSFLVHVISIEG